MLATILLASTFAGLAEAQVPVGYRIDSHWPTGKRDVTIVNTQPALTGWTAAIQNAIGQWNAAGADIRLTYAEGALSCTLTPSTQVPFCYDASLDNQAFAELRLDATNHTLAGRITADPDADLFSRFFLACHEIGHILGISHQPGDPGACDAAGSVTSTDAALLRQIYGHTDTINTTTTSTTVAPTTTSSTSTTVAPTTTSSTSTTVAPTTTSTSTTVAPTTTSTSTTVAPTTTSSTTSTVPPSTSTTVAPNFSYACTAATNITATSATVGGVTNDPGAQSATFVLRQNGVPVGSSRTVSGATTFSTTFSGLAPDTAYTYTVTFSPGSKTPPPCAFTTQAAPTTSSTTVPPTTSSTVPPTTMAPSTTTTVRPSSYAYACSGAINVTATSATLRGVTNDPGSRSATFVLRRNGVPVGTSRTVSGQYLFSTTFSGLAPNTAYTYTVTFSPGSKTSAPCAFTTRATTTTASSVNFFDPAQVRAWAYALRDEILASYGR